MGVIDITSLLRPVTVEHAEKMGRVRIGRHEYVRAALRSDSPVSEEPTIEERLARARTILSCTRLTETERKYWNEQEAKIVAELRRPASTGGDDG